MDCGLIRPAACATEASAHQATRNRQRMFRRAMGISGFFSCRNRPSRTAPRQNLCPMDKPGAVGRSIAGVSCRVVTLVARKRCTGIFRFYANSSSDQLNTGFVCRGCHQSIPASRPEGSSEDAARADRPVSAGPSFVAEGPTWRADAAGRW
jgi:hypothetical protein